jgi:hypothetical protein
MSDERTHPLDAEEARLARSYGALRGGEPSPEMDANILAQARAAVGGSKRRPKPWFTGAGFGVAATTVMAAGLAWQLGWLGLGDSVTEVRNAPVATQKSELKSADDDAVLDRVDVEFLREEQTRETIDARERRQVAPAASGGSAPAVAPDAAAAPQNAPMRKQAAPARAVMTPPPAAAPAESPPAPPAPPAPAVAPEPAPTLEESEAERAPDPFPAASEPPLSDRSSAKQDEDRAGARDVDSPRPRHVRESSAAKPAPTLGASRADGFSDALELPHWSDDAQLDATNWIERIRMRVSRGDRHGARNSLRQFALDHPQRAVPRDLQRLLVE